MDDGGISHNLLAQLVVLITRISIQITALQTSTRNSPSAVAEPPPCLHAATASEYWATSHS